MRVAQRTDSYGQVSPRTIALGVLVGAIAGLVAVVFRAMIGAVHNLTFLGFLSFVYDDNRHTSAGPLGAFIVLVPVAGALAVAWIVYTFAPEAKGHGVPEVIGAIYSQKGRIRPAVALEWSPRRPSDTSSPATTPRSSSRSWNSGPIRASPPRSWWPMCCWGRFRVWGRWRSSVPSRFAKTCSIESPATITAAMHSECCWWAS